LPQNSMVFQLPVAAFPEISSIYQMVDYEHFRSYLFTRTLHYSYGTNKGRGDADWQMALSKLSPADMATKLEAYGFGAIMINRKGYEDKGARLINEFVNNKRLVVADNGELVAIRLKPAMAPILRESPVFYSVGWSVDEGTHRWAVSSRAEVNLFNNSNKPRPVTIGFTLITLKPRNVKIGLNGKTLQNLSLGLSGSVPHFKSSPVTLAPGQNTLFIETDVPPELPGNADPRKLSFGIRNFEMEYQFVNK